MAAWRLQPLQPAGAHVKATVTHKTTIFGLEAAKHQWEWWLVYLGMGNYLINNGGFHPVIPTSYTNQLYQPVIPTSYTNRNQTMGVSIQFLLLGSIAIHRWFVLVWLCPAGGGKCIHQPDDDDWVPPKKTRLAAGLRRLGGISPTCKLSLVELLVLGQCLDILMDEGSYFVIYLFAA